MPFSTMSPIGGDRALADRAGDHPGLAEPAAAGAAAEDLHREALVDGLGERHQRLPRVGPRVEVHQRVLVHPPRHPGRLGATPLDPAVGQVVDVVELGHVDGAGDREPVEQLVARRTAAQAGAALVLPLADHLGDREHDLLAVAEHGGVEEVRDRLGVEGGVAAGQHDRVVLAAVDGVQRDAGQVERGEHVGVAELGGERDAEDVEGAAPGGAGRR